MKIALRLLVLTWVLPCLAIVEIGEKAPELCWKKMDSTEVCTKDLKNKVSVLVYSTGWCPGCQDEMSELSSRYSEIKNSSVEIVSLSAEGFKHGQAVDEEFLKAWQKKFNIPFMVAASPNNAGKEFFKPPYYIPATVILDRGGVVRFKKVDASVDEIFQQVRTLIK
ncbi:hypothetical protein EBT16_02640 [bacterium]|nr:hypothetical protein [bacterium]